MTILIGALLLVAVLAIVLYPLLTRSRQDDLEEAALQAAQRLRRARERVYEEIRTLQQERFMGELSEEEHRARLNALREQAARLMQREREAEASIEAIRKRVERDLDGGEEA